MKVHGNIKSLFRILMNVFPAITPKWYRGDRVTIAPRKTNQCHSFVLFWIILFIVGTTKLTASPQTLCFQGEYEGRETTVKIKWMITRRSEKVTMAYVANQAWNLNAFV